MPISLHSHSGQFCKHAYCSLEEIVLTAIDVGFTHYGLSEHMPRYEPGDLYEEEVEVSETEISRSFKKKEREARICIALKKNNVSLKNVQCMLVSGNI